MSFARSSAQALKQASKAAVGRTAGQSVAKRSYSLLTREAPKAMMAGRLGVSQLWIRHEGGRY